MDNPELALAASGVDRSAQGKESMTEELRAKTQRLRTMDADEVNEECDILMFLRKQAQTSGITKKKLFESASRVILEFEKQRKEAIQLGLGFGEQLKNLLDVDDMAMSLQEEKKRREEESQRLSEALADLEETKKQLAESERARNAMQRQIDAGRNGEEWEEDENEERNLNEDDSDDELQRILRRRSEPAQETARRYRRTRAGTVETRRSQSRESERSRVSSRSGNNSWERKMIENMTSQALPPVPVFTDGFGLKAFSEFIDRLELKYKDLLGENRLVVVLREHLGKTARSIFDSVTRGKDLSYSVIVRKMKERYRGDTLMEEYSATAKWESVRMREGENLTEFTLFLEQLAERAFPKMPEQHLAPILAKKLVSQLAHWRNYQDLLKVMDHARKEMVYVEVKEEALRMETVQRRGARLGQSEREIEGSREGMRGESKRYERREGQRRNFVVRRVQREKGREHSCDEFWAPLQKIDVQINGVKMRAIVDTGAEITVVPIEVMREVEKRGDVERVEIKEEILEAAGSSMEISEKAVVNVQIGGVKKKIGIYAVEEAKQILLGQNVIGAWGLECLFKSRGGSKEVACQADMIEELDLKLITVDVPESNSGESVEQVVKSGSVCESAGGERKFPPWMKCFECHGRGHGWRICPTRKKRLARENNRKGFRNERPGMGRNVEWKNRIVGKREKNTSHSVTGRERQAKEEPREWTRGRVRGGFTGDINYGRGAYRGHGSGRGYGGDGRRGSSPSISESGRLLR